MQWRKTTSSLALACVILLSASSLIASLHDVSALSNHSAIVISGDSEFTSANGVASGSGTTADPYVIENWEIASGSVAILIKNTTSHFTIRNVHISHVEVGIRLSNVSDGVIEGSTIVSMGTGIDLYITRNARVADNNISNEPSDHDPVYWGILMFQSLNASIDNNTLTGDANSCGVTISWDSSAFVADNRIANHAEGIVVDQPNLESTITRNVLQNNTVGIYFTTILADVASLQSAANSTPVVKVYHNNFLDIRNRFAIDYPWSGNLWNANYPQGGNYWSNYNGSDQFSGPNQDVPGSDGFGDAPYTIWNYLRSDQSQDRYPSMSPLLLKAGATTAKSPQDWTPLTLAIAAIVAAFVSISAVLLIKSRKSRTEAIPERSTVGSIELPDRRAGR
jgi:Right handed beta helix region